MIKKIAINSSTIKAIGYDPEIHELEIDFNKGTTYLYYDVPPNLFAGLAGSASKGKYLNEHIAKVFEYDKIK